MEERGSQLVIALDGPAGVGKSTVAMKLATRLGLTYVETGAIYRAVALLARRKQMSLEDVEGLSALARGLELNFRIEAGVNRVYLDKVDVTQELRDPETGMGASKVASIPQVREALLELQRRFATQGPGSILEGRDIGTVVFPQTPFKYFVTATLEERASRRHKQLVGQGKDVNYRQIVAEITQRDEDDSTREVAPLKAADDALIVDTTLIDADEVVEQIVEDIRKKQANPAVFKAGFITIVGRPNAGKSTLLNAIMGQKLAIVTPKPNTTRNRIMGIATFPDAQMLFLDTPGIHEARGSLNKLMVESAITSLMEADVVVLMVDALRYTKRNAFDATDRQVFERVSTAAKPTVLVINKVDKVSKEVVLPITQSITENMNIQAVVPMSALRGDGVQTLLAELKPLLGEGAAIFPKGQLTNRSRNFVITELIREQVFLRTHEEVPYAVAVSIDLVEERPNKDLTYVAASIHVERKSQKSIIIGKGGLMIKSVGRAARKEIETFLGRRVFLELHVRVDEDWSRSLKGIQKVGWEA